MTNPDPPVTAADECPVLWHDDLRAAAPAPVSWLWQGYLAPGNVTLLTSQWKAGKTTLLAILLDRMRAGGHLAGLAVAPGKALVVSEESPAHWLLRGQKWNLAPHVCWLCRPFKGKPTAGQWRGLLDRVADLHRRHGLRLLAIDPLAAFLPGKSEGHADLMLEALLPLQRLTDLGLAVLALHHPRKAAGPDGHASRGSGALPGFVDILVEMHWFTGAANPDRRRRLQAWSRYEATPRQLVIELNSAGTDYHTLGDVERVEFGDAYPVLRAVLADADYKMSQEDILEAWPAEKAAPSAITLWRWLDRAVGQGAVCRDGDGRRGRPFRYWLPGKEGDFLPDLPPFDCEEELLKYAKTKILGPIARRLGMKEGP